MAVAGLGFSFLSCRKKTIMSAAACFLQPGDEKGRKGVLFWLVGENLGASALASRIQGSQI